ncbi:MAG: hypothetical protein M5U05_18730 [Anaerolineales bacterium]|nr:hypothetical protein [Anaerolineales bacterium]
MSKKQRCIDCHHLAFLAYVDGHNAGDSGDGRISESRRKELKRHEFISKDLRLAGVQHIALAFRCGDNRWGPRTELYVNFWASKEKTDVYEMSDAREQQLFDEMVLKTDHSDWGCFIKAEPGRPPDKVIQEAHSRAERAQTHESLKLQKKSNKIGFWGLIVAFLALLVTAIGVAYQLGVL